MATTALPIDPETMDLDALRSAANTALSGAPAVAVAAPAAAVAEPEAEPEQDEVDEVVYRREIDLGDGSGKQVFEGATLEELVDKLANAQTHATKKIRELSQAVPKPKPTGRTADEEWVRSQELLNNPTDTVKKMFEELVGEPIENVKTKLERAAKMERAQASEQAAQEFVAQHADDYYAVPENAKKMYRFLDTYKLEHTVENYEKAFEELSESGLLKEKPQATDAESNTEAQETKRIAEPVRTPVVQPRRTGSGITAQRSARVVKPAEPTEEELYAMPLEELEKRAMQAAR